MSVEQVIIIRSGSYNKKGNFVFNSYIEGFNLKFGITPFNDGLKIFSQGKLYIWYKFN